jgi:hypothetical protein
VAVTFVDWRDMHRWKLINDALGIGLPEPAETYSTSEHLFTDLSIPPGVTGTLPRALRGARAGLAAEEEEDLGETGRGRNTRQRSPDSGSAGGRSRSRSRSRQAGGDTPGRGDAVTTASADGATAESGEPAPRTRRRRRRTRGGNEVARGTAAEQAAPTESTQQAS